ncbi:MAG TPA: carotenoid 1,2-hydratase, partial [Thermoanaerobaculia bacterium]|nr:carotenoid 1,2-hydratase [Thermoanaerobaculia bacterium]
MSKLLRGPMSGSKIAGFPRGTRGAALAAGCLVFTLAAFAGACRLSPQPDEPEPSEKAERTRLGLSAVLGGSSAGFARALAPRAFRFPEDHGPHPEFRTEWWYATGNLATPAGRRFGFQLTFFRNALAPETPDRPSRWAARDVYMAHFALTDAEGGRFLAFERFRRGALGLAGARALPFRVALDDWSIASLAPGSTWPARLRAQEGGAAIDIQLDQGKPPVLEGDRGLSQKSAAPGQASYYYSLPRMPARGDIRLGGESFAVSGLAWLDREWSTSALAADQVGWDWLALQLDDGRELMLYRLRRRDGSADPASRATLILAD